MLTLGLIDVREETIEHIRNQVDDMIVSVENKVLVTNDFQL